MTRGCPPRPYPHHFLVCFKWQGSISLVYLHLILLKPNFPKSVHVRSMFIVTMCSWDQLGGVPLSEFTALAWTSFVLLDFLNKWPHFLSTCLCYSYIYASAPGTWLYTQRYIHKVKIFSRQNTLQIKVCCNVKG